MMFPGVLEVELCGSGGKQSGDCTYEVALFGHRVNYDHDGIFSVAFWKFCYEIDVGSVPGCIQNWKGVKFSGRQLTNGFSPKAHVAGGDIFAYVSGHLWPPVVSRD